ncbi:hypothetical protein [Burkholderia cepacia]|uniref:hypothetical protein n=1 Tax=Burkholderia cepacia TaxID=292 RepID=UPI000AFDBCD6|nr:hypothetical protein [Burkholderia cepacia]
MALQMPITFADGTSVPAAYFQAYLEGTAAGMTVRLQVWTSQAAVAGNPPKQIVSLIGFEPNLTGGQSDVFTQAYAWVKTQPGFANAVNV